MHNRSINLVFLTLFYLVTTTACSAQQEQTKGLRNERYTFRKGSYDGIGKWYMGREIAHVMGYHGISWLERKEREKEENTSKLIKNMDIQADDVIADIGAGSGYHVFKMAPLASTGQVYAVDIQEEMLAAIEKKQKKEGLKNITRVKGSETSANLKQNSLDKVLMVDVYHEFNFPYEMLLSIKAAMKSGGELYLIEYRAEDDEVPIKPLHKMSEAQAVKEMKAVGLNFKKNIDNLPWQHCLVFVKP